MSTKNPWHSLAWVCQKCWRSSYNQSATTLIHCQVASSFFLDILREWVKMRTPAKSCLSLLPRAGDVHLGGHVVPRWRPSKAISLPWIWSCMKPENCLRIDLSCDWCLCIAARYAMMHAMMFDWIDCKRSFNTHSFYSPYGLVNEAETTVESLNLVRK